MKGLLLLCCLAAAFSAAAASDDASVGCFENGRCDGGTLVGSAKMDSAAKCLSFCQLSDDCTHFTYTQQDETCVTKDSCPTLDKGCNDCFSGESSCPPESACYFAGQCQGYFLGIEISSALSECQQHCVELAGCSYFTLDTAKGLCTMFADCGDVDAAGCAGCVSGHMDCATQNRPLRFMLVGGMDPDTRNATADVEVFDLYKESSNCQKPSDLPMGRLQSAGSWFAGRPVACGGFGQSTEHTDCFEYGWDGDEWTNSTFGLLLPRYSAEALVLEDGSLLVVGGLPDEAGTTSDLVPPPDGPTEAGPAIPELTRGHCSVLLNSTHAFVSGDGWKNSILNLDTMTWTKMPDSAGYRMGHACGLVERPDTGELEVVAAGGIMDATSEIFSLSSLTWRAGPDLPLEIRGAASVQMAKSFVIAGGYTRSDDGRYLDTVYEFDRFTQRWSLKGKRLFVPRGYHATVVLPDSLQACT